MEIPPPADTDFMALERCPLRWRWTEKRYRRFDPGTLSLIRALRPAARDRLWAALPELDWPRLPAGYGPAQMRRTDADEAAMPDWLLARQGDDSARVVMIWHVRGGNLDAAIMLPWRLFASEWDDFYYPMDDIAVFPLSLDWLLFCDHEETFFFGRRA